MVKKYYMGIEIANYYLERFKSKENFFYHLKNFIEEDVREWKTKPPKNIDAICNYGWKVYNSLKSVEEKKNFIYALLCMPHRILEAFRNMKLVEVKKILTTVKVNENIFKNFYLVFDEDNFRFLIYDYNNELIGDISNKENVLELCKYLRIPIGGVNENKQQSGDFSDIIPDIHHHM
ncbi:MAG: hypothetical protein GXN95_05810 [Methanococci archaeon]|nr:hypothetical protein [Methanococci archaeon]